MKEIGDPSGGSFKNIVGIYIEYAYLDPEILVILLLYSCGSLIIAVPNPLPSLEVRGAVPVTGSITEFL